MAEKFDDIHFKKVLRHKPTKAVDILYKVFYEDLCHVAFSVTHDIHMAEDVVQEFFSWVLRFPEKLAAQEGSAAGFLRAAVKTQAIRTFRRAKAEAQMKYFLSAFTITHEKSVEAQFIERATYSHLRTLVSRLPLREKQCLEMKLYENLKNREIAERQNVKIKAVERSITSAYRRLREWMTGGMPEPQ